VAGTVGAVGAAKLVIYKQYRGISCPLPAIQMELEYDPYIRFTGVGYRGFSAG
jgi:hypothetical protein